MDWTLAELTPVVRKYGDGAAGYTLEVEKNKICFPRTSTTRHKPDLGRHGHCVPRL